MSIRPCDGELDAADDCLLEFGDDDGGVVAWCLHPASRSKAINNKVMEMPYFTAGPPDRQILRALKSPTYDWLNCCEFCHRTKRVCQWIEGIVQFLSINIGHRIDQNRHPLTHESSSVGARSSSAAPVEQKSQPLTRERSSVGARPSSAAPVEHTSSLAY